MIKSVVERELIEVIKSIKLLVLDVDGVLTNGRIIYDFEGRELRFFNGN